MTFENKLAVIVNKDIEIGTAMLDAYSFIHGVMNTDNMAFSGETIDYGSRAFIDEYSPDK